MRHGCIASAGLALAMMACGPVARGPDAYDPNAIFLELLIDPADPATGEVVTFTISAHAVEKNLVSCSIDFENDGKWDETRPNDDTTVGEVFTHAYATAATYTVRARVVDSSGTPALRSKEITVAELTSSAGSLAPRESTRLLR